MCKFHIFWKIFLLSRQYLILLFGFMASKTITLKKFEICMCLSIIYISLKIIFQEKTLGFIPAFFYLLFTCSCLSQQTNYSLEP